MNCKICGAEKSNTNHLHKINSKEVEEIEQIHNLSLKIGDKICCKHYESHQLKRFRDDNRPALDTINQSVYNYNSHDPDREQRLLIRKKKEKSNIKKSEQLREDKSKIRKKIEINEKEYEQLTKRIEELEEENTKLKKELDKEKKLDKKQLNQ